MWWVDRRLFSNFMDFMVAFHNFLLFHQLGFGEVTTKKSKIGPVKVSSVLNASSEAQLNGIDKVRLNHRASSSSAFSVFRQAFLACNRTIMANKRCANL